VINEPPNTKLVQEDILAYISRTAAAASETNHGSLPILPSTLSSLSYSILQFDSEGVVIFEDMHFGTSWHDT
jgi:hypothetical protein